MSEHEPNVSGSGEPPAPPPIPSDPATPSATYMYTSATPAAPRRKPLAYVAVLIGLIAMVGGAVFFARSLAKPEGGADTPAAAVRRLFDALSNEDVLGVLEALPPSERDSLRTSVQQITAELSRLGVLATNVDLSDLPGIELEFTGLRLVPTEVGTGVTSVAVTAGSSTYRVDPDASPLGDFVRGLLPPSASKVVEGSDDLSDNEVFFTAIKEGDRWYVSLWYSTAEAARGKGTTPPPFGRGLPARGAPTPEKAVEDLIRAAVGLDVRRLIELTPADEARALHDYAPLFLPQAEAGVAEMKNAFSAQIREIKLSSRREGDSTVVKIDDISFRVQIPELGMAFDYDGECVTVEGEFFGSDEPQRQCGQGLTPGAGLPQLPTPDVGFVVVERGGEWFVSPTRTLLEGLVGMLKALDRKTLDSIKELVESFSKTFGGTTF
jgi:hypothetical protein